ncbi:hypothetical protein [Arthrobacter sp. Z1-15]
MAPLGGECEPVLVMAGLLLPFYPYSETQIRVWKRQKIKLPRSNGPFYTYMTTPRPEADAMAWLKDNGGNDKLIKWALEGHRLLRVPPGSSADALKAFTGFRLVPRIKPPERISRSGKNTVDGFYEDPGFWPVSWLTAEAVWGKRRRREDFPSPVRKLSAGTELEGDPEAAVELALDGLHNLLAHQMLWLMPVRGAAAGSPEWDWGWFLIDLFT